VRLFDHYEFRSKQDSAAIDRPREFVDGHVESALEVFVGGEFLMAATQALHERMTVATVCADLSRCSPRIGRRRAFNRLWSASIGFFAYRSTKGRTPRGLPALSRN
jgi:hypothetical protein